MTFLNYKSHLKILLNSFKSCSLVNADGALLYSKDCHLEILTTTRLVAFQIIKKYLNPRPQDFFILNDPENGGYHYSKPIFVSCLNPNLFLIWDENNFYIDFKIPPTPLFEQGLKNKFIWQALVSANMHTPELESFFEYQKKCVDNILRLKEHLDLISSPKNQKMWLNTTQGVFSILFDNKAHGSAEGHFKILQNQFIKLKFSAEEKQNQRLITLDFTNTHLATDIHTSSHVVESAIIKKIIDFYQIEDFFTQSILDKIKIILPPKSIVSKAHPTGSYNFELQTICSQLCEYNMTQLNSHSRKSQTTFQNTNFLYFEIHTQHCYTSNYISSQNMFLNNFEDLITKGCIKILKMKRADTINIMFQVTTDSDMKLNIKNNTYTELPTKQQAALKINNDHCLNRQYDLKKNDVIEILWKTE